MTKAEALEALTPVFREVFDDDSIEIDEETTAADIDEWDSVEHFNLISEIESRFKMRFSMREVSGMKNVGELAEIVAERGKL
ncbi:MAG: acyl carrier protein [Oscillospiraceae bacterium]|nr:acyl carrier protein [Oscillospiraceae bacterium]